LQALVSQHSKLIEVAALSQPLQDEYQAGTLQLLKSQCTQDEAVGCLATLQANRIRECTKTVGSLYAGDPFNRGVFANYPGRQAVDTVSLELEAFKSALELPHALRDLGVARQADITNGVSYPDFCCRMSRIYVCGLNAFI